MASRPGDWDLVRTQQASVHRWLCRHAFPDRNGKLVWVGKRRDICPATTSRLSAATQKRMLRQLEQKGKIAASYQRPFWTITITQQPPADGSDLPSPPSKQENLRYETGRIVRETVFNRREALWFWLYGRADSTMLIEMPSDRIPGDRTTVLEDLDFLKRKGCLETVARGGRTKPHIWRLLRPPDDTDRASPSGYHKLAAARQRELHMRLLRWLSENSGEDDVWEGKTCELPKLAGNWRRAVKVMAEKGLLEILFMEPYIHRMKLKVSESGRELADMNSEAAANL